MTTVSAEKRTASDLLLLLCWSPRRHPAGGHGRTRLPLHVPPLPFSFLYPTLHHIHKHFHLVKGYSWAVMEMVLLWGFSRFLSMHTRSTPSWYCCWQRSISKVAAGSNDRVA